MAAFGKKSLRERSTCHPGLRAILDKVITIRDCSVIKGARTKEEQDKEYEEGDSEVPWPHSKHNITKERPLSEAFDIVPWPEQYSSIPTMIYLAGIVMATAELMRRNGEIDISIRWGSDWNKDGDILNESFRDFWHFEIIRHG